jgi:ribonuclease HI
MDKAAISVVARNNHGHIIKAWAKLIAAKDPAVAEASAINWAMEQAECENYKSISVESDSKLCIDALSSPIAECPWKIHAQISLSLDLASHFNLCTFLWARRDANQVAHVLAKVALSLCHPLCCNSVSLPPSALEVWTRDLSALSN